MIQQNYTFQALPLAELESVGLVKDGRFNVSQDVQEALLAGRRTEMLRFDNLESEDMKIPKLDAKVSIQPKEDGTLELLIHPIYKEASYPSFLNDMDAEELQNGQSSSISKIIPDGKGGEKEILVEYDGETKEFVITDSQMITVPDWVNNVGLTAEQKQRYRKGKEVELQDGTVIQHASTDSHGIRSNKLALVASIIIDGGISYVLCKGLNKLFNQPADDRGHAKLSENYKEALTDMHKQKNDLAHLVAHEKGTNVQRARM
jgi:hypothetical protein